MVRPLTEYHPFSDGAFFIPLYIMNCAWVFQADPKKYRISAMLNDEHVVKEFHWRIKQHKNDLEPGQLGLIWASGKDAGILALVKVVSKPELWEETESEKNYWVDSSDEEGIQLRVKLMLLKNLTISKDSLMEIDGLQDLRIIKQPWGKNPFKVLPEQWELLRERFLNT